LDKKRKLNQKRLKKRHKLTFWDLKLKWFM